MSAFDEFQSEYHDTHEKSGMSGMKKVMIALLVLVLIIAIAIGAAAVWINSKYNAIEKIDDPFSGIEQLDGVDERPTHEAAEDGKKQPINFLIMGTDSRISAGDPNAWSAGAQRTDALLLMQISGDRESINVMSIPRDSWVSIPGHGENKVNAAFSFGGPSLAIATVEQLTGVPIDHIAIVDFTSFKELTDVVGGVTMTTSTEGTKHYDGEDALRFVRERKNLPGGDFDRVRRQQLWIQSVMGEVLTKDTLGSPSKIIELYDAVAPHVAVDDGLGVTDLVSLGLDIRSIRADDMTFLTAPYSGTGRSADGQSIVNLDQEKFNGLAKAFKNDTVVDYIEGNQHLLETLDSGVVR